MKIKEILSKVNFVVAVGSVDGICTGAAVLRNAAEDAEILFCQAFTVDKIDPEQWSKNRNVLFVDLAVNNRDISMTTKFVRRLFDAGHGLVGVLDEHNDTDWRKALITAGLSDDDWDNRLAIKPISQDKSEIKSSGALLLSLLGDDADEQTRELCEAADAGDRMNFSTHFGGVVNQAVKSRIADDSRRIYLAKHFAKNHDTDEKINGWIAEYETILKGHKEIVSAKQDLGNGIVRITTTGKTVDMTTLMSGLYRSGAKVVVCEGMMFDARVKKPTLQVSFGTGKKGLDLMTAIKTAVNPLGGFASKVNVELADEVKALEAVRKLIIS